MARHMSQSRSGCNTWLEDLIQLRESTILSSGSELPGDHHMDVDNSEPHISDEQNWMNSCDFGIEGESIGRVPLGGSQDEGSEARDEVTEYFPDPPLAFEGGYTFLNLFDSDENSIYRKTNLYYPFSCRREWRVASWLLRSGLSMAKIDSFLSLEMVSVSILMFIRDDLDSRTSRSKIYIYHSPQQKSCGVELKHYRAVHTGSHK